MKLCVGPNLFCFFNIIIITHLFYRREQNYCYVSYIIYDQLCYCCVKFEKKIKTITLFTPIHVKRAVIKILHYCRVPSRTCFSDKKIFYCLSLSDFHIENK